MRKMGIGVQLFTLRNETAADFPGTLHRVAEVGYEGVEFAGYGGIAAGEMKRFLQETGLQAIGSHVGLQNLRNQLQTEIDYLLEIGGKYMICPSIDVEKRQSPDDWKRMFAFFEEVGAEASKHGLTFAYHNHAFEFDVQVDGQFAFDALYAALPPELLQMEMDVCWLAFAGKDTLGYMAKYAGRLPLLHLKDYSRDEEAIEAMNQMFAKQFGSHNFKYQMATLELGQGEVPLVDVIAAAPAAGVEWLIVEQDMCLRNPPLQSVANSMSWLKQHNAGGVKTLA